MSLTVNKLLLKMRSVFRDNALAKRYTKLGTTLLNGVFDATITVGSESSSAIVVSIACLDSVGQAIGSRHAVDVLLLADSSGNAFNTNDYTVAAGTNGAVSEAVADKVLKCITEADGTLDISLTITGNKTCYVAVVLPGGGLKISGAVTHSDSDD